VQLLALVAEWLRVGEPPGTPRTHASHSLNLRAYWLAELPSLCFLNSSQRIVWTCGRILWTCGRNLGGASPPRRHDDRDNDTARLCDATTCLGSHWVIVGQPLALSWR